MQVPVVDLTGSEVGQIDLNEAVFGVPMRQALVYQAVVRQQANARQGTRETKTRAQVSGGGRKPWAQKHTGRARAGSRRSPLWRKGGVTFGPHPRDYSQRLPRKMRRLAIRCLLSDKQAGGNLVVLREMALAQGKSKEMAGLLAALEVRGSALVVTRESEVNVIRSARNLQKIKTLPASLLNVLDLLRHEYLVITVDAVHRAEELWGREIDRKRSPVQRESGVSGSVGEAHGHEPV